MNQQCFLLMNTGLSHSVLCLTFTFQQYWTSSVYILKMDINAWESCLHQDISHCFTEQGCLINKELNKTKTKHRAIHRTKWIVAAFKYIQIKHFVNNFIIKDEERYNVFCLMGKCKKCPTLKLLSETTQGFIHLWIQHQT